MIRRVSPSSVFAVALGVYALIFLRDILGGAFRYYVTMLDMPGLWFVPDYAAAGFVALNLWRRFLGDDLHGVWLQLVFFSFYGFLGYEISESWEATVSAFKMVLPLIFGLAAAQEREDLFRQSKLHWIFLGLSIFGILLSQKTNFPWTNFAFGTKDILRQAAEARWINTDDGMIVNRLSGFAQDNTMAGTTVAAATLILMLRSSVVLRGVLFILSFGVLYLTTSRSSMIALTAGYMTLFFAREQRAWVLRLGFSVAVFIFVSAFSLLPLLFDTIVASDVPASLTSLVDRLQSTWTHPWAFMYDTYPWALLTGLGLGPVGYPALFSPYPSRELVIADNFAFTNFLMFGLAGLIWGGRLLLSALRGLPLTSLALGIFLILLGTGIQGYGNSLYGLLFGLVFGMSGHDRQRKN